LIHDVDRSRHQSERARKGSMSSLAGKYPYETIWRNQGEGRNVQACATVAVLQLLSAAAAIVAAGFWLWSALTSVPKRLKPGPAPNLFDIFDDIHVSLEPF
jgi:hypothetical protein